MYYVYEIFNKVTGRKYIGMTFNHWKRYRAHMSCLKSGRHTERQFQKDYVLYGEDSFDYRILEVVDDKKTAHQREIHYMNINKTYLDDYGYNSQDVIFNKYQTKKVNESVNCQNFFYQKIKETGLPLYKVAKIIGISRKSLIHGITHPGKMQARAFTRLVNFLPLTKEEALDFIGWLTDDVRAKPQYVQDFCSLSDENKELILKLMEQMCMSSKKEG